MEVTTAVSFLAAGSSIIAFAHPEALKLTRASIDAISDGGPIKDAGIPAIPITNVP
jgi:hypothetical protein